MFPGGLNSNTDPSVSPTFNFATALVSNRQPLRPRYEIPSYAPSPPPQYRLLNVPRVRLPVSSTMTRRTLREIADRPAPLSPSAQQISPPLQHIHTAVPTKEQIDANDANDSDGGSEATRVEAGETVTEATKIKTRKPRKRKKDDEASEEPAFQWSDAHVEIIIEI